MTRVTGMAWMEALTCALVAGANDFESQRWHNWHQWRGPSADGIAYHATAPRTWDENTNIQWKVEIPGSGTSTPNIYSSLTSAQDKVYITGRDETTLVLKHGPAFEVLAANKLDEGIDASAVFVGNQLFLRGARHLYCIAEKAQ